VARRGDPAANGHGNARQSPSPADHREPRRGERSRFYSEKTGESIFETQANGVDLALGVHTHFGMGYGLASSKVPIGPARATGPG